MIFICRWLFLTIIHAVSKSRWPNTVTRPAAAIKSLRFALFVSWTVHAMEPFSSSSDVADEVNANNINVEYFILIYFVLYLFMQSNTFCVRTTLRPGHDVGICFTSCYFNKWTDKRLNKWVSSQIRPNTCIRQYIVSFEWTVHIIPLLNFVVNYKDRTTS